ncbi:hypothetical protein KFU94_19900 [Chloroflexi bacterium TSY]|nr:hypothetical protein [Chloroflexi bacterium TSY]
MTYILLAILALGLLVAIAVVAATIRSAQISRIEEQDWMNLYDSDRED